MSLLDDLRGKSRADQFTLAANFIGNGATPELLDGLWRTESNRATGPIVSKAGAQGPFQIMPQTQATWETRIGSKLNVNDFTEGLVLAAHQLKENLVATDGHVADALRMYNAGPKRSRWSNPETQAYAAKVLGVDVAPASVTPTGAAPVTGTYVTMDQLKAMGTDELMHHIPAKGGQASKGPAPSVADLVREKTGPVGMVPAYDGATIDTVSEKQQTATWDKFDHDENKPTFGEKLGSAIEDTGITAAAIRLFTQQNNKHDPEFAQWQADNWQEVNDFAQDEDELAELRTADSKGELLQKQDNILRQREMRATYGYNGGGEALAYGLVAGVVDPAGWALGGGVTKGFELLGIGSRTLMAGNAARAGRSALLAGSASLVAENALGAVLGTAALDVAGTHFSAADYGLAAATGGLIGAIGVPFNIRGKASVELKEWFTARRAEAVESKRAVLTQAQEAAGPGASPELIAQHVARIDNENAKAVMTQAQTAAPAEMQFFPKNPADMLTNDPAVAKGVDDKHFMGQVPEKPDRDFQTEVIAQSDAMVQAFKPSKVKTLLTAVPGERGFESTATTLLNEDSSVLNAVAMTVAENPTGHGGRRVTAAIASVFNDRQFSAHFMPHVDSLFRAFMRSEGVNPLSEFFKPQAMHAFNKRVYMEVVSRDGKFSTGETNRAILEAADRFEAGMQHMAAAQREAGTLGAERLAESSKGYAPRKLQARKVAGLDVRQRRFVQDLYAEQLVQLNEMDRPFANKVAARVLSRARKNAVEGHDVPMNLHDPEGAELLRDALEGMRRDQDGVEIDIDKLLGKFSRGGAAHTKKRLKLDLSQKIIDKDGNETLTLGDLMNQDISSLYRGYSRRVAGEIALANVGIYGKHGVDMIREAAITQGATKGGIQAYNQLMAEILNTPIGDHNHKYMDNLRVLTSVQSLGGMGFTQMGEYGNAINAIGVTRMFAAIGDLPRMVKEIGQMKKGGRVQGILSSIETLSGNIGMDGYSMTRMFDVPDNRMELSGVENLGVGTRALRAASHAQSILSLHRVITAGQTRGMAEQIIHKAMAFAKSGADDVALNDMGIDANLRKAIRTSMEKDGEEFVKFKGGKVSHLDLAKSSMSGKDKLALVTAIERGSSQIIQRTYAGETGKWAHNGFLKMLFQFRTFGLTSVEKQWGRNVANHGILRAFGATVAAASFAIPIYLARIHTQAQGLSRSEREEFLAKKLTPMAIARNLTSYASSAGLSVDAWDTGSGLVASIGDKVRGDTVISDALGGGGQNARGGNQDFLGGVAGPSLGTVNRGWQAAHGNTHALTQLLPFGRLPGLQVLLNHAATIADDDTD